MGKVSEGRTAAAQGNAGPRGHARALGVDLKELDMTVQQG